MMEGSVRSTTVLAAIVLLAFTPSSAAASGHGPLFAAATPTLGKGAWQFDQAWMVQSVGGDESGGQILRSMIGVGITERVQVSVSAPVPLVDASMPPFGRMMSSMSFGHDVEILGGWRFQTHPVGLGARFESTVFAGGSVPLTSTVSGLKTAPAAYVAVTTGYASRSQYVWVGVSHNHTGANDGDRIGRVTTVTAVYGYRPPQWRLDYPRPDLRFFVEAVSDSTTTARLANAAVPNTGGHVTLVGPSMLLLYKAYALEGGILFPVYEQLNGAQPSERFRLGVNFTYFFWPGSAKGHRP
jgi:hypothetical protein